MPLDGSERAEQVLQHAENEAEHHQAVLIFLRVIPPLRLGLMVLPNALDQAKKQLELMAWEYLELLKTRYEEKGIQVEIEVRHGPPADHILAYAKESACDLIIIGSHGDSGAINWRFGSISNKVIKTRTTMPVMVVNT